MEESELGAIEDLVETRGMVLDDLLACAKTDFGISTIFTLLNGRVERRRLTVVTSDRDLETIDALVTSLASRLAGFYLSTPMAGRSEIPGA